jgi:hypothetical protein
VLLAWLAAYYHGISGSQSIIHGDLLEAELTASGMLAPFVQVRLRLLPCYVVGLVVCLLHQTPTVRGAAARVQPARMSW